MKDYGPPRTRGEALRIVAAHTPQEGYCGGCFALWVRLTEYPCAHLIAARAFLDALDADDTTPPDDETGGSGGA